MCDGIFLTRKTRLAILGGILNAERYQVEIVQLVAISYLHSLGLKSVLQDDNGSPTDWGLTETTSRICEWRR